MEYFRRKTFTNLRMNIRVRSAWLVKKFPCFLGFNSFQSFVIRISRLTDWTGHENDKKPRFEYLRSGG